ncbi:hypothetical protein [Neisseria shayeganii]|uniref:Uncharacterized protein n=1 Tax=Neisseria shayeganii TaxID=607712 RepID=A0A7D7SHX5_9NEIS|nr:hypothetical protein [Neisseria shayeganii]QMT41192.1 hypothetical protein H3L94_03970 [Neisseria shayeganii]
MEKDGFRPYQAPATPAGRGREEACFRQGNKVWLPADSDLPCRCVRCGSAEVVREKSVKLHWYPPALALILLTAFFIGMFALIAFGVLAALLRKRTEVTVSWCAQHARIPRRQMALVWAWVLLTLLAIGAVFFGSDARWGLGALGLLVLAWLLTAAYLGWTNVRAVRIDAEYSILKGFGRGFLDTLPPR